MNLNSFFQYLLDKTLNLGSEKCSGSKESKICLTRMAAANALSKKCKCLSQLLHIVLKILKASLVATESKKKSWMVEVLYEKWSKV